MGFKIGIVGLGLMGGSLAYALRGFRGARIVGVDMREDTCRRAVERGAVDEAYADPAKAMEDADLLIFCVYARQIPCLIREHRDAFASCKAATDICGVKSGLYRELEGLIPAGVDYVGVHPMAGGERDGFDNADPAIFRNSGWLICPLPATRPETVTLMEELARHIGAVRLSVVPWGKHDEIIAYTSNLMHIAASVLCMDYHPDMTLAFAAGAFRDCTRVADINAGAWTELLLSNRIHTGACLDRYIQNLQTLRQTLRDDDAVALHKLLTLAGDNKREMLRR